MVGGELYEGFSSNTCAMVGVIWSIGASCIIALTIQVVPAANVA
jgi:hypothetical protein